MKATENAAMLTVTVQVTWHHTTNMSSEITAIGYLGVYSMHVGNPFLKIDTVIKTQANGSVPRKD